MPSPADRQAEALADVERIAQEFYYAAERVRAASRSGMPWTALPEVVREGHRAVVRNLLRADVIRVGRRPDTGPEPMAQQMEIVHAPTIVQGGGRYRQQTAKEGR